MNYLTGQAYVDFEDYITKEYPTSLEDWTDLWEVCEFYKIAHIKKFFEKHHIQFGIEPIQGGEIRGFILDNKFTHHWVEDRFETEEELLKVLIPLANLIYNQRTK